MSKRKPQRPIIGMMPVLPRTPTDAMREALPHMLVREQADGSRDLSTLPGQERCDFCSAPDIVWAFGCEDVELHRRVAYEDVSPGAVDLSTETHGSKGNWAACKDCKFLIDRKMVKKLADRSARTMFEVYPEMKSIVTLATLRRQMMEMHQKFWLHRKPEWDHPYERRSHGHSHPGG